MVHTVERDVTVVERKSASWKVATVILGVCSLILAIAAFNLQRTVNDLRNAQTMDALTQPMTPQTMPGQHRMANTPGGMAHMAPDLGVGDAEYDRRFIDAMVPHHEGAVIMANDALKKSLHPELRQMAQSIIDSQQKEIQQLRQWKSAWYGSTTTPEKTAP